MDAGSLIVAVFGALIVAAVVGDTVEQKLKVGAGGWVMVSIVTITILVLFIAER